MKHSLKRIIIITCIAAFVILAIFCMSAAADNENLYNKDETVTKQFLKNGEEKTSTSFAVSGYIKVSANEAVNVGKIYNQNYKDIPLAACFDADKNFIKDIECSDAEIERVTSLIAVANFTTPENTAYIRVNFDSRFAENFVVTSGEKMNSDKIYEIIGEDKPIKNIDSVLFEKSILFIGDSLCNGSTDSDKDKYPTWGWAGRFAFYDDMKVTKTGCDGFSMAKDCGSAGQIVTQLLNNKGKKFDYVLLEGGVNDGWFEAPVGQMIESFDKNDFDQTTFAGGFEYTIATAKELFPESTFGFLLYFRLNHPAGNLKNMKPIWDEAIKICKKWDIPVLDLYSDKETCNKYDIPYCKEDADPISKVKFESALAKITVDGCHPNGLGYDRLYNAINDFLIEITEGEATSTPTPAFTPDETPVEPTVDPTATADPAVTADSSATVTPDSTQTEKEPGEFSALPFIIAGAAIAIVAGVCVAIFGKKKKA